MTNDLLKLGASELGVSLEPSQLVQFADFEELLYHANEKINLTRIPREQAWQLHYLDSLAVASVVDLKNTTSLIDVGTGAGFPGIPLKIAFPKLKLTLLDSLRKRLLFLDGVIESLQLSDTITVHARAEDLAHNPTYHQRFDCVTARAVANLAELARLCLPLVRPGGVMVALKSEKLNEELASAKEAISDFGGQVEKVQPIKLLGTVVTRNLVVIRKQASVKMDLRKRNRTK